MIIPLAHFPDRGGHRGKPISPVGFVNDDGDHRGKEEFFNRKNACDATSQIALTEVSALASIFPKK